MHYLRDLRSTPLFREASALYAAARQPGTGQIFDAAELHVSSDGRRAVYSGTFADTLESSPLTRVCSLDLDRGDSHVLTSGPNNDRLPKWSPDGRWIAFLSDRRKAGNFQLQLFDVANATARPAYAVDGWVEYLHWSPGGTRILLGVAGHGADVAGGQGAVASKQLDEAPGSWMPRIETGLEAYQWRSAWIYELDSGRTRRLSNKDINVWEAAWCGDTAVVAVVSNAPGEGHWYSARLQLIDMATGRARDLYSPRYQLGCLAASQNGNHLSFVEAICSDRGIVAGEARLLETSSGRQYPVDTCGVDIAYCEWRSNRCLLLAGHRSLETVIGRFDLARGAFTETWSSKSVTTGGRYVAVSGIGQEGDCALITESYTRGPQIERIRSGRLSSLRSFDCASSSHNASIGSIEAVNWTAPDGLSIEGWLLCPRATPPFPLVMNIHGGPVWHWRPMWLGRGATQTMLLKRGYAIFLPNPRGSTGRGQEFVRKVLGDMGGQDTHDFLSGLDHLVQRRLADPKRLGVTGGSYGGFMTSWLVTQDSRFAAAVSLAPITNHVTRLVSNLSQFVDLFLDDRYTNPQGRYFTRSPIVHAEKVRTPTLSVCGALDRCTPPEEAVQFHNALLENGVKSVLVTYPQEGHGIRNFPAAIDYAARVVGWFEEHMPAT